MGMPKRPAAAVRWIRPLVEPPMACSTTSALRKAAAVITSLGLRPPPAAKATACLPLASALRRRSACVAGMAAERGSARPMTSTMQAMVLAVPMTMQVPGVGARRSLMASISMASMRPPRCSPHRRRQSVQAPSCSPLWWPTSIGPTGTKTAGTSAEAAAIICAGIVLSQPPISTTESIGCARSISSVSMAIRLRRNMLVGQANDSWIAIVGNSIGRPPASMTPRLIASTSLGTLPWQALKSLKVLAMPTIGRASASSDRPIALMKALRRKSENSASPYDVRPFFRPVAMSAAARPPEGRRAPPRGAASEASVGAAIHSVADLVADAKQMQTKAADDSKARRHHGQARPRRHVADAEEAVAKAVDHVEERVEVAHRLPHGRQRLHRVEDAGEKGHRHDEEVLEGGDLVELLCPEPGDEAERAHQRRPGQRENDHPERIGELQRREPHGHQHHSRADGDAAHDRSADVGDKPGPVRERRDEQEDEVAGDLALDQRRARIGERVLQHAHHDEAGNEKARVADRAEHPDAAFEHVAKDEQVEDGREHRRGHRLEAHLPEAQHLLVEQRPRASKRARFGRHAQHRVRRHAAALAGVAPCMISMNTSSRSARPISRSSGSQPAACSTRSIDSTSRASCAFSCTCLLYTS